MRAAWLVGVPMLLTGACLAQTVAPAQPVKPLQGPVCVVAGRWKGSEKTTIVTSADGRERLYGWLRWDRPGKWTGQRCEAVWWVFASLDGGKFKPILGRQDFLREGQRAELAVVGFSEAARRVAADVMTVQGGTTAHGYFSADLEEHTSCIGSAVKGLDGVRAELDLGDAPWLERLVGVRDDGWLELSVRRGESATGAALQEPKDRPRPLFEPCSGKVRVER